MTVNMRSFLILLLVLTLPINGMAQLLMPAGSSVHHAMADMEHMDGMDDMDGTEGDCHTGRNQAKTTLCKPGQECKTVSLLQIVAVKAQVIPAAKPVITPYNGLLPARVLDAVWHPPRA
ncbi:hypothetical protein MT1_2197 [Pseudomonas sp. MT-1]|uniref:hypothetical protein n=1 Tax=Stutzerimonas stutzeri TaxID=316 RepID=UPI0005364084|nr:hypothetical protein [Stutzerimonas stutzeri]MCQ4283194.1 hypothetical protein [Stutzerimonas stutzeri]BAP79375.1 hypothetical protein MT1_2197 [Pseudomonas sp. MT-1]